LTSAGVRTLFVYWGRRGAISEIFLELVKVAGPDAWFSLARQNELFGPVSASAGDRLIAVDTFNHGFGAIARLYRLWSIRRRIVAAIEKHRIERVVVLMSHVWTPLIAGSVRGTGARYVVVVHDAANHLGDVTAMANAWLIRDALKADEVVTLSAYVRDALIARYPQIAARSHVLFLPVMRSRTAAVRPPSDGLPGFLFFGRIMTYKGLPLFVEACEILRARGHAFRIGVAGEGNLGQSGARLAALGAVTINRWLDYDDVSAILAQYDCMVLANIEASQSGVVALAHGFGMPVVANPVGGLTEQIRDRQSGLVARAVSAAALADAMEMFLTDAGLRAQLAAGVANAQEEYSMVEFFRRITESHPDRKGGGSGRA